MRRLSIFTAAVLSALGLATAGTAQATTDQATTAHTTTAHTTTNQTITAQAAAAVPKSAHIVVVMLENHSFSNIIGSKSAPYINSVAAHGALFTNAHAVTHPSQPNYLALFSGSTHGVTSDACPQKFNAPNLAADLLAAHKTFVGYAENLPSVGSTVCSAGNYARKHVPWTDFTNIPAKLSQPFGAWPSSNFNKLPAVSWVIPNLCDDMHNCSPSTGDSWLRAHLNSYLNWARSHNSLLIITWDENDGSAGNRIPTIIAGQQVKPGRYATLINHYNVLRTIEDSFGLKHDGAAAKAAPITTIWKTR